MADRPCKWARALVRERGRFPEYRREPTIRIGRGALLVETLHPRLRMPANLTIHLHQNVRQKRH